MIELGTWQIDSRGKIIRGFNDIMISIVSCHNLDEINNVLDEICDNKEYYTRKQLDFSLEICAERVNLICGEMVIKLKK